MWKKKLVIVRVVWFNCVCSAWETASGVFSVYHGNAVNSAM